MGVQEFLVSLVLLSIFSGVQEFLVSLVLLSIFSGSAGVPGIVSTLVDI